MKKTLSFILTVMLIAAVWTPFASAQTLEEDLPRPVLPGGIPEEHLLPVPDQQSDEEILLIQDELLLGDEEILFGSEEGAPGELLISVQEHPSTESDEQTWDAAVEGGTAPYYYQFYMVLPTYINGKWIYYAKGHQPYSTNNSYTFTFQCDGEYQLWIDVRDSDGRSTRFIHHKTVTGLGVQPLQIDISDPRGSFFTEETSWDVGFAGGDGNYKYVIRLVDLEMDVQVLQDDGSTYASSSVVSESMPEKYSTDNQITFGYQFLASSRYELRVWLKDSSGRSAYTSTRFSAYDEGYPTVYEKATEIVKQCRAEGVSGDYQTALWLHDWLTDNADYDYTYGHYHADGVMCGGFGVCDSYAKAYLILLNEAGIPVERVNNIEHAWNAVQLGGEWYYTDCTWDDLGRGNAYHVYCFVPEEIMSVDHPALYDSSHVCNSYLYNYYVQNGEAQTWAESLAAGIGNALREGVYSFSVPFPESYTFEGKTTLSSRLSAGPVLADELSVLLASESQYIYPQTGETIPLRFETVSGPYDKSGRYLLAGQLVCEADYPMISLPAALTALGPQAFMGDQNLRYVIVPEGTQTIGSGAFADCGGLWMVLLPRSVTSIAADAFDKNNPHLTLCVPADSYAQSYAKENGFGFQVISE